MKLVYWLIIGVIRVGGFLFCRLDRKDLQKIPTAGPLILVDNHINSLEVPLLLALLQPRKIIGLAKVETWDNKFMGWLFDLWEMIPVRRGDADLNAIRNCIEVLNAGKILAVAPEGTRSWDGKLLPGQPGVAFVGLRTGVPIVPIAHWGIEDIKENLRKIKRTDVHIRVGRAFVLDTRGEKITAEVRQNIADEIMCQIACLLPQKYHGFYGQKVGSEPRYLRFI